MERMVIKDGEINIVFEDGKYAGWYKGEGAEKNMAETFERMAFEAGQERDAAALMIKLMVDPCEVCARNTGWGEYCEQWDGDCEFCGNGKCPCKNCRSNSNFYFDYEKAKEIKEKYESGEKI